MKQKLRAYFGAFILILGIGVSTVAPVGAINVINGACRGDNAKTAVCNAKGRDDIGNMVETVIETLLFVIGIIAVIMIVIGGIRYTLSAGDASQIKSAKDTVLYSVIGLVVALLAYAIVNFVTGNF